MENTFGLVGDLISQSKHIYPTMFNTDNEPLISDEVDRVKLTKIKGHFVSFLTSWEREMFAIILGIICKRLCCLVCVFANILKFVFFIHI